MIKWITPIKTCPYFWPFEFLNRKNDYVPMALPSAYRDIFFIFQIVAIFVTTADKIQVNWWIKADILTKILYSFRMIRRFELISRLSICPHVVLHFKLNSLCWILNYKYIKDVILFYFNKSNTAFNTCSRSTQETLEKCINMSKVNNKNIKTRSLTSFWCFYC